MSILGRGLESLIPKKDKAPEEPAVLDVLHHQAALAEPIYRFHEASVPVIKLATEPSPVMRVANAVITKTRELMEPRPEADTHARKGESVFWVDTAKVETNPFQPRREFDGEELKALAKSIEEHGILQPLLVTKRSVETPTGLDVRYELIAGERRLRAAKIIGLREVPVIIRHARTPNQEKLELALIENVQREDLNAMERARAFHRLIDEFGLMQKDVAERIGKSREMVSNALRLLRLPVEVQAAISGGEITEGHARALLMLGDDKAAQLKLFAQMKTNSLSVRDSEMAARFLDVRAGEGPRRRKSSPALDPDSRLLQRKLEEAFGTRVSLIKKGEQGKIVVAFYSEEELQGIIGRISRSGEE